MVKRILMRRADGSVVDVATGRSLPGRVPESARFAETRDALMRSVDVPEPCGDAIAPALARGPLVAFLPVEMVPDAEGVAQPRPSGWRGRLGARRKDVWDRMIEQARRAHAGRGKDAGPFAAPFSFGQISAGRDYVALTERCASAGLSTGSDLSTARGGGGGRSEALQDDLARLRSLHRRIGTGPVARFRPRRARRDTGRVAVLSCRSLVDQVCLEGRTLSEILRRAGWSAKTTYIAALRADLREILDRMQGYSGPPR